MSGNLKIFRVALLTLFTLVVGNLSAQTIMGNVKDSSGEPIIGATVQELGTKNIAVTDLDGNFSLKTSGKQQIQISYIGMKTKKVNASGKSNINVVLEDEATTLNDVVVIGYGTVRKKDLTGAVTSVNSKQIENIPVSNVTEAMTGKMAGVNITTTEGSPDAEIKIRVRGGGSLSQDNSPLYIVDGFPVSSISDIAPSEIQSIDVLKDASSTAIYGARGANGVIIVTTKSGKEGKVQVNFNASYGWKNITKEIDVLNPYEFVLYQYEAASANNKPTNLGGRNYGNYWDYDIYKSIEGSNFQDEVFGNTGTQAIYNANVSGGSKDFKYNVSYSHNQENSIMEKSGYNKDNVGAKLQAKLNKWLTFDFNGRMAYQKIRGLNGGADTNDSNAANSLVGQTLVFAPVQELVTSDDEDEENSASSRRSPTERLDGTHKLQTRFQQNYNASLTWKPFKHWTAKTEFGYGWKYNDTEQAWTARAAVNSKFGYSGRPQAYFVRDEYKTMRNANTITYDNNKLFGGRDHINVLIGHEWSTDKQTSRTNTSVNFPVDFTVDQILAFTNAAEVTLGNTSDIKENVNMLSFFGRINYTMMDKYLLTFTLREDGSSKFGKDNRWGLFPSLALAWRLSDEKFMKGASSWLSNLKMRLSFGTAGNNRIPSGMLSPTFAMSNNTGKHPGFNNGSGEVNTGMMEIQKSNNKVVLYNPDLKWETTTTRNFGIDYGFFRGRVSGTLDFYWNTTDDLLMLQTIPSATGYERQFQNVGSTSNKGIEFATNVVVFDNKRFNLNFNFNIAYNSNKIDKLAGGAHYETSSWGGSKVTKGSGDFMLEEGGRLGELWGYKQNGFYTVFDPATGKGDLVLNGTTWRLATAADGHIGGYNADGTPIYTDVKDESYTLFNGSLYPGVAKVQCDEDGKVVYQRLGNTVPKVTGGLGFDGMLKTNIGNFDFNVFCNYSLGNKIYNATAQGASFMNGTYTGWNIVSDYDSQSRFTWVDPESGLNLGRLSTATLAYYGSSEAIMSRLNAINANARTWNPAANTKMVVLDSFLEDASFLRINNITVGYTLPKTWVKKLWLESVRVYFTAYNVYCFTNYSGYDPEVDTSSKDNPMTPGIDYAAYPKSRSFVAGINVSF